MSAGNEAAAGVLTQGFQSTSNAALSVSAGVASDVSWKDFVPGLATYRALKAYRASCF
jgi:hypothetical protein